MTGTGTRHREREYLRRAIRRVENQSDYTVETIRRAEERLEALARERTELVRRLEEIESGRPA